ncbi:MAG: hypothetical protein JWM68_4450 [Verrucomicrobiales bacterium]|nr:hypothetical protein [Verrucomicrobiales bacterium]
MPLYNSVRLKPVAILLLFLSLARATAADLITIVGATTADQPLPQVAGVKNIEVFHASAGGWTYNHHVDLGAWKKRLYVAWDACEKDEDVGVSRELYATSKDGLHWSEPKLLFPQGISTAMRMYFFHAPNGHMLAVAGLRTSKDTTSEYKKGSLIVREIHADHSLGDVFLLRPPNEVTNTVTIPPLYSSSRDRRFVEACEQLLKNKSFLEQQDYGRLLGNEGMKWHDVNTWSPDEPSRAEFNRFGKAMCFYHRADGALVGMMKWGWVTLSRDEGKTWSQPVRPPSLVVGMAKVWGERTRAGKYALFYNPHLLNRFPLVMVHGDDGITFGDMRIVNGERLPLRFPGLYKAEGQQYVRGISEWSSDGSWKDNGVWVVYSQNKEDIWVSRVPSESFTRANSAK